MGERKIISKESITYLIISLNFIVSVYLFNSYVKIDTSGQVENFYHQNYESFLRNDSLRLSKNLGKWIGQARIMCLKGYSTLNDEQFFQYRPENCNENFFARKKIIKRSENASLQVEVVLRSNPTIEVGMTLYLILQSILLFSIRSILKKHFQRQLKDAQEFEKKINEEKLNNLKKLNLIASQVAHDIRSPLAALKMAIEDDCTISDYRKLISSSVQRINDIANNLLAENKSENTYERPNQTIVFLAPILDSIISEKRMQYKRNTNLEIELNINEAYDFFINVNVGEFNRVISNLVNNAVEAIVENGKVNINISNSNNKVLIRIDDNGKGIPESVLKHLGQVGLSYGKNDTGSGLGIYHAKNTIESFGGLFEIESTEGEGTTVKLYLPRVAPPVWFLSRLLLTKKTVIYVLDDDESIHQLWNERLRGKVKCFESGELFSLEVTGAGGQDFICLVDYELKGQLKTGLEIIDSLKIAANSVLVTSRFDDVHIIKMATEIGVQIIPKNFISILPISMEEVQDSVIYEYVYIEDDELLRISWERKAERKNLKLLTLKSVNDFSNYIEQISKESTKIYIDSRLGEGQIRGEEFAKILHEKGYRNIFIASGYEEKKFEHLPWLKISGKSCPF